VNSIPEITFTSYVSYAQLVCIQPLSKKCSYYATGVRRIVSEALKSIPFGTAFGYCRKLRHSCISRKEALVKSINERYEYTLCKHKLECDRRIEKRSDDPRMETWSAVPLDSRRLLELPRQERATSNALGTGRRDPRNSRERDCDNGIQTADEHIVLEWTTSKERTQRYE